MGGLPELARYSLIAGYIQYLHPNGRVLDIGCGEGLLALRLGPGGYARYLGLDIASTAVAQAAAKGLPDASFLCADAESFATDERFDVIVLNEVLYYFADPIPVLERCAGWLAPGGHFVGSMVVNERTAANWRLLDARFAMLDETTAKSGGADHPWTVRVWSPERPSER